MPKLMSVYCNYIHFKILKFKLKKNLIRRFISPTNHMPRFKNFIPKIPSTLFQILSPSSRERHRKQTLKECVSINP
ncbi:hypothetical protein L6452_31428 [Arctium lappa]|uniref:Uncharacterized protein n=1 Tax=Arctium lappa TaxID=4217 RepID=A0ACB8Z318_ARCLA|nr:hypothetical protein L6452_31428 [Arctium lappa]